eukprot:CAMPEP_0197938624 /NCGR_PEP_ID=MMETSP1439-20131203/118436_1 /TAXON_ID=66791 /ORGANISM="Gonyaulax spinifera, Strain CCMP409" /LENGTH=249 /DNA_ID=CAMNT_0043561701 /DNA_START=180 /DNA_END=927 /DNA_ORIENTATION=+
MITTQLQINQSSSGALPEGQGYFQLRDGSCDDVAVGERVSGARQLEAKLVHARGACGVVTSNLLLQLDDGRAAHDAHFRFDVEIPVHVNYDLKFLDGIGSGGGGGAAAVVATGASGAGVVEMATVSGGGASFSASASVHVLPMLRKDVLPLRIFESRIDIISLVLFFETIFTWLSRVSPMRLMSSFLISATVTALGTIRSMVQPAIACVTWIRRSFTSSSLTLGTAWKDALLAACAFGVASFVAGSFAA